MLDFYNVYLKPFNIGDIDKEKVCDIDERLEIIEGVKIIDSPGFAVIDAMVDIADLPRCYPEYFEVEHLCKFRDCSHTNEPECKVKELVDSGVLSKKRYERYIEIYNEVSKRRVIYEKN